MTSRKKVTNPVKLIMDLPNDYMISVSEQLDDTILVVVGYKDKFYVNDIIENYNQLKYSIDRCVASFHNSADN